MYRHDPERQTAYTWSRVTLSSKRVNIGVGDQDPEGRQESCVFIVWQLFFLFLTEHAVLLAPFLKAFLVVVLLLPAQILQICKRKTVVSRF